MYYFYFIVALLISSVSCGFPDGSCSLSGQACGLHDNVLDIFSNIYNFDECYQICKDDVDCTHITYYGDDSFPFSNTCITFSSCSSFSPCNDCISADMSCLPLEQIQLHSAALEGKIGQNLLGFLPDQANETECRTACLAKDNCNFYTYHTTTDPVYPGVCYLLDSLLGPITPCEYCKTGVLDVSRICSFLLNDEMSNSGFLIADTDRTTQVELIALGTCKLAVLAVGGGGQGYHSTSSYEYGGGGGSGYVEYTTININGKAGLNVEVGAAWEKSIVTDMNGSTVVEAKAGYNGGSSHGGMGYCGGGASGTHSSSEYGGGDGGTDGGYGENSGGGSGGTGSSVKVETIQMPHFILSPGKGGKGASANGGGGGGLLVDGKGAPGGHEGDGEGYGGGGWNRHEGKPGVVLLSYFKV